MGRGRATMGEGWSRVLIHTHSTGRHRLKGSSYAVPGLISNSYMTVIFFWARLAESE